MRTIERGGEYLRVADPEWRDPLDGGHAGRGGGRWNPPGSFGSVYLCASVAVARANVYRLLRDQPYGPEDLNPATAPTLIATRVPADRYADLLSARGLESAGLPPTYPRDARGRRISWSLCQRVGLAAWDEGHPGIACRSAGPGAPAAGRESEELAFFDRGRRLRVRARRRFDDWFWGPGAQ
ncbi:MAG: RES domain-containing protein [Solirubrobacterales bacterium]